MLLPRGIITRTLVALLTCQQVAAVPEFYSNVRHNVPRQEQTTTGNAPRAVLEPIIPPMTDEDALLTLATTKNVTLAWAGSSNTNTSKGVFRRDGSAVLTQATFEFRHPTVALDHSTYISQISCSNGKLTAKLTDKAYAYVKKRWPTNSPIIFVTAVQGCGKDEENDYFLARSVTFSDTSKTFTASGAESTYKQIGLRFDLSWGDVGVLPIKRAHDKRHIFAPHPAFRRRGLIDVEETLDFTFGFGVYASNILGVDSDAPWPNAVQLLKVGKDEPGVKNDTKKAWEKGELSKDVKKFEGPKPGKVSGGLEYGVKLYCVQCGFGGQATIYGTMGGELPTFSLTKLKVGFKLQMKAGANAGFEAYALYKKEYLKQLARINLAGWKIPLLADIGPFIQLSLLLGMEIKASGNLLIGSSVVWDHIEIELDLLDSSKSFSRGWSPRYEPTFSVSGELNAQLYVGLPVKIGLGVNILEGTWEADASFVETPKIVAEGKFEATAALGANPNKFGTDVNEGCYGIVASLFFSNTLQFVLQGKYVGSRAYDLMDPVKIDLIEPKCLSFERTGGGDGLPDYKPQGTGSGAGLGGNGLNSGGIGLSGGNTNNNKPPSTTTTTSRAGSATGTPTPPKPACTPGLVQDNPSKPKNTICGRFAKSSQVLTNPQPKLFKEFDIGSDTLCRNECLLNAGCQSYSYTNKGKCTLYNRKVFDIAMATKPNSPDFTLWDKDCYIVTTC
ncbi:hypothetical protein CKM354_001107200 [Cercospora kikuchii]|uniref:Apple domain-containing protein n=1 Tax=Cercospora kikuchii TaxID=84275 RepID=A0A9P3CRJ2_9PEZI|nr:uncharacterized protein CKM354_001107200 [Cercospora kikuchii]GIZ47997.1 hypothetical protein CKM354_001107200 [Cercospora kikuchii]